MRLAQPSKAGRQVVPGPDREAAGQKWGAVERLAGQESGEDRGPPQPIGRVGEDGVLPAHVALEARVAVGRGSEYRQVDVGEVDMIARRRRDLRDPDPHQPCTDHADILHPSFPCVCLTRPVIISPALLPYRLRHGRASIA